MALLVITAKSYPCFHQEIPSRQFQLFSAFFHPCQTVLPTARTYPEVVVFNTLVLWLNEYFVELNKDKFKFFIQFWIELSGEKDYWIMFGIEYSWKMILNNPLNWILSWNEWMNHILTRYLPFLMKSTLFCLFWTLCGQILGTFPIRPVSMIPWPLNWIIFWIESAEFFFELNNILNWILAKVTLNRILN